KQRPKASSMNQGLWKTLWSVFRIGEETHVHADPGEDRFRDIRQAPFHEALTPSFAPGLAIRLDELVRR
ncbi:MAG: hypothetical protein MI723_02820, partial [Caulobacterales bacterium]|nr:hypothetical protein [Caulobacterales bacterium]